LPLEGSFATEARAFSRNTVRASMKGRPWKQSFWQLILSCEAWATDRSTFTVSGKEGSNIDMI
jgi:hypothetical protein